MKATLGELTLMWVVALMLFGVTMGQAWAAPPIDEKLQKEIETMLVCMDDCGMIVSACDNSTAEYMRGILREKLAQGMDKEEVLNEFVKIYGTKVLAAPPKEGFNITAWVTPFVAIIAGALIIYFVVDKWVFNQDAKEQNAGVKQLTPVQLARLEEYEDKLNDELKKYM